MVQHLSALAGDWSYDTGQTGYTRVSMIAPHPRARVTLGWDRGRRAMPSELRIRINMQDMYLRTPSMLGWNMRGMVIGFVLFCVAYAWSLYIDTFHFGCGGRWSKEGDRWTCRRCGKVMIVAI